MLEVKDTTKGPKILVSRTHPELVKRLFEEEVTEVRDGTVEIKSCLLYTSSGHFDDHSAILRPVFMTQLPKRSLVAGQLAVSA